MAKQIISNTISGSISRQLRRHRARENAKHGKQSAQAALNNFLWKIAMNNGGVISISRYELDQIPPNAALASTYDSKTNHLMVKAMLQPSLDGLAAGKNGKIHI